MISPCRATGRHWVRTACTLTVTVVLGAALPLVVPTNARATVGQEIAYTYHRGDWYDVFTIDADGTSTTELTREGTSRNPSWSADGSRIAFIRTTQHPEIKQPRQIWMMRADGSNKMRLRSWKRDITCIDWAPDSNYLAVADLSGSTRRILRLNIETGATRVLYERSGSGKVSDLDWSRGGSRIAFTVKDGSAYNSAILNVSTGAVSAAPAADAAEVAWAGGSDRLAMSVRRSSTTSRIKIANSGSVSTIFSAKRLGGLSWAPGDGMLAFDGTMSTVDSGLYVIGTDGTGLRKLVEDWRWQYPQFVTRDPEWRPTPTRDAPLLDPQVPETCEFGGPATLNFTLLDEEGLPIAGAPVQIQSSTDQKTWETPFAVRTTSAAGVVTAEGAPQKRRYYRAIFAGDSTCGACVAPIREVVPRAYLTRPSAPSTVDVGDYFTSRGYLKPHHEAGSYPVRLYCYRLEGGDWVLRRIANAKASDYDTYTRYAATISLPYSGDWKIVAYHRADDLNADTYSATRYLTVK